MTAPRRRAEVGGSVAHVARDPATVTALYEATVKCTSLLRGCGEEFWASQLGRVTSLRDTYGDSWAIRTVLEMFGGSGSLNDVVLHPDNGHMIRAEDIDRKNEQLRELTGRIYESASRLERESP